LSARTVTPEWLDELPVGNPEAVHSRRDLQRVNAWMGNARLIARHLAGAPTHDLVELGAGDGTLLLHVARRLPPGRATLVDRQALLTETVAEGFRTLGWSVVAVQADAFDWVTSTVTGAARVIVANLFLHHFADEPLRRLLASIAAHAEHFVACEPARTAMAQTGARLLPLIGCNSVTCHDARLSVAAGFVGRELSALWPVGGEWRLHEAGANVFSHLFAARRTWSCTCFGMDTSACAGWQRR
jgi:hypothetical protein